ncbi:MAG TPA: hypothetical protein VFD89_04790 [Clostridia bacterium]|nr:hypothetical protein [Clostridia bacterium]
MKKYWITQDSKPCMTITLSSDATLQERYAAGELKNYLDYITSSSMPIGDEEAHGSVIAIGKAAARIGVIAKDELGDDGFTLRTVGNSLAVVGGKRGIMRKHRS